MSEINNDKQMKRLLYDRECLGKAKQLGDQAQGRLKTHEDTLVNIEKRIEAYGVKADEAAIDADLARIDDEVEELLSTAESMIPFDLLRKYNLIA